ncbi:MAG TPA: S8 family serine peptidase, partial [Tepidisphaeraceae bacterium]|nr:S8 family serine peptidase [Tepidisphaeraceae bacterium]
MQQPLWFAEPLEPRVFLSATNSISLDTNATGVSGALLRLAQTAASPVVGQPQSSSIGSLLFDKTGRVGVRITATDVAALSAPLASLGFIQSASEPNLHFVEGYLPVSAIDSINNLTADGLMGVLPIYKPLTSAGSVDSEGDAILEADRTRAATGNTGAGVTVGVLSDSYNNLGTAAADVTSGDLPSNVNVLQDNTGGGTDEGRAMLQIVHDIAPGANLAFATADISEAGFAQNIINLAKPVAQGGAGANIITDDITYLDEPFFQDGPLAQAVNTAVTTYKAAYFVSAGNYDTQAYESTNVSFFNTTITGISGSQRSYYNFNPSGTPTAKQSLTLAAGQEMDVILQWDQPFFTVNGVTTNLNFYLLDHSTGAVVASATDNTLAEQEPIQFLGFQNTGASPATYDLVIRKTTGPTPGRIKYVNYGSNDFGDVVFNNFATNSPTVVPHSAAVNAMSVAAAPFYDQRNFESFESEGPATILFDASGNRLASADVRAKPDITAIDGVNNTVLGNDVDGDGSPNFFGTSAAGPHAAAVAALIKAANPTWTPAQIYADLKATADPNIGGSPGNSNFVGAGLIDAYRAVVGAPVAASVGFNDGFETGFLSQNWQTYTSGSGRSEVLSGNAPSSGSFQLIEDGDLTSGFVFSVPQLSEAILHVNLASVANAALSFDEKSFANSFETTQIMPAMFIGHGNYDGVSMSVDGAHWYLVQQLTASSTTTAYQTFTANLSAIAAANGLTLTSDTQIKFQHFDPDSLTVPDGGFAFDNVRIALGLNLSGPAIYLKLEADGQHLDIWNNSTGTGPVDQSILLSQVLTIAVTGTGPSESLTIDFTAGDPLVPSGITYTAAAGASLLDIIGDNHGDTFNVTDTAVNFTSSFGPVPIVYNGVTAINLTGGTGNDIFTQSN